MVSGTPYRYCPECRGEYLPTAERCLDCDLPLVAEDDLPSEPDPAALAAFPPASDLHCVRVAPLPWIRALSEALQDRGVTHRVEPAESEDAPADQRPDVFGNVQLFGLYLEAEHAERASGIDGRIAEQLLPEAAPAVPEGEAESCPACGTALAADAVECPDCGLAFG